MVLWGKCAAAAKDKRKMKACIRPCCLLWSDFQTFRLSFSRSHWNTIRYHICVSMLGCFSLQSCQWLMSCHQVLIIVIITSWGQEVLGQVWIITYKHSSTNLLRVLTTWPVQKPQAWWIHKKTSKRDLNAMNYGLIWCLACLASWLQLKGYLTLLTTMTKTVHGHWHALTPHHYNLLNQCLSSNGF